MIVYDTKNWATTLQKIYLSFSKAYTTRVLFKYVFLATLYTTVLVVMHQLFAAKLLEVNPLFFSLLGVILSLMLVFRLNSSYDKWWEGRKAWGTLINQSRMLAAHLDSLLPASDTATRHYFAAQIANYAMALQAHLRDQAKVDDLEPIDDEYDRTLRQSKHLPNKIVSLILGKIEVLIAAGTLSREEKIYLKPLAAALLDVLGICERIKNTPIPFSHNTYIKTFIMIYVLTLPFGIVHTFGYYTIITVALVAYALIGVEVISEEVEEPFGREANDLPLIHMANIIKESAFDILHSSPQRQINAIETENPYVLIIN